MHNKITQIEADILQLLCRGKKLTEISDATLLPVITVKQIIKVLYSKTNSSHWIDLVTFAVRHDIYQINYFPVE
ncbi:MAG: helix-turn-helix transcriptional regulator [Candidatus Cyclobacteriaceae bacterium M3_2C_046]